MADVSLLANESYSTTTVTTVHIVDDNTDMRLTTSSLVRSIGLAARDYASGLEFLEQYDSQIPGCVVLDVEMPGMSGLELQEVLNEKDISPPIIFITGHADISRVVQAIRGGAVDLLVKPFCAEALFQRIREGVNLDLANRRRHALSGDVRSRMFRLTARENQIAKLLAEGESVKQIAHCLSISPKTVDNHRARILDKMGVDNPTQLAHLLVQLH
jgi:FixJ family two-component response regulator